MNAFVAARECVTTFRRIEPETRVYERVVYESSPTLVFQAQGLVSFECEPGSRIVSLRFGAVELVHDALPAQFFEQKGLTRAQLGDLLAPALADGGELTERVQLQLERLGRCLDFPTLQGDERIRITVAGGAVGGFAAWGVTVNELPDWARAPAPPICG